MLKTFLGLIVASVLLSFHSTLWVWALVPMAIAFGMVTLGLAIDRRTND